MKVETITAKHPLGFNVTFALEDGDNLRAKLEGLAQKGYSSPTGDGWRRTPEGLPICPYHQQVMSKREKQGDEWHSHKIVDEHGEIHYCRGYPHKHATGWQIKETS